MIDLLSMSLAELNDFVKSHGFPAFRANQLFSWLMRGTPFHDMTNLPLKFRETLAGIAVECTVAIDRVFESKTHGTQKFLCKLTDGNLIESVLMRYHHGNTLCISSQVGCKMRCAFCASTLNGHVRDLTAGEMLGQVITANAQLGNEQRVRNVVIMGSGEPLDNYDNVLRFIRNAADERGLNLSVRGISLSTCGLVPQIYRLSEEGLPLTLCISLHAPNDAIRQRIMPIASTYSIEQVMSACRHYVSVSGRRAIIEYVLIDGLNDGAACADQLASILRNFQCHVNVIPLNSVKERSLRASPEKKVAAFVVRLTHHHISVTRRREMGDDIQGACGQLRNSILMGDDGEE